MRIFIVLAVAAAVVVTTACTPKRADVRMAEGLRAQQSAQPLEAARAYRAALAADPGVRGAANNLAVIAAAREDATVAATLLEGELKRHPTLTEARINRALLRLRLGELAPARLELEKIVAAEGPHVGVAREALAVCLVLQGAAGDDVRATLPASDSRSANGEAIAALVTQRAAARQRRSAREAAAVAAAAGDWSAAETALDGLVTTDPGVVLDRAVVLAQLGRLDEARALVASVLAADPADARAKSLAQVIGLP